MFRPLWAKDFSLDEQRKESRPGGRNTQENSRRKVEKGIRPDRAKPISSAPAQKEIKPLFFTALPYGLDGIPALAPRTLPVHGLAAKTTVLTKIGLS